MKVKEYLSQIEIEEIKIINKKKQLEELRTMATSIGSPPTDSEYVQSSSGGDRTANIVLKIYDLEREIERDICKCLGNKEKIINEIHELHAGENTSLYINILLKRYMWGEKLEKIAVDAGYSYEYIRHKHGRALQTFARQYNLKQS